MTGCSPTPSCASVSHHDLRLIGDSGAMRRADASSTTTQHAPTHTNRAAIAPPGSVPPRGRLLGYATDGRFADADRSPHTACRAVVARPRQNLSLNQRLMIGPAQRTLS